MKVKVREPPIKKVRERYRGLNVGLVLLSSRESGSSVYKPGFSTQLLVSLSSTLHSIPVFSSTFGCFIHASLQPFVNDNQVHHANCSADRLPLRLRHCRSSRGHGHVEQLVLDAEFPLTILVDLPTYRDVGVIFTEPGYAGSARFIIESKGKPECLPLKPGPDETRIGSLMVCRDTACTFFTGDNCDESDPDNFSVRVQGPGDVPNLNTPAGNVFQQVCCGQDLEDSPTGTQGAVSKADFVVIPVCSIDFLQPESSNIRRRSRTSTRPVLQSSSQASVRTSAWPISWASHRYVACRGLSYRILLTDDLSLDSLPAHASLLTSLLIKCLDFTNSSSWPNWFLHFLFMAGVENGA